VTSDLQDIPPDMPKMPDVPHRRLRLKLDLGADSWQEMRVAIKQIEYRLLEQEDNGPNERLVCTSGGCGSGWHLEVEVNVDQSPENYQRQLRAYVDSLHKAKEAKP
jgi:hypothetical protein